MTRKSLQSEKAPKPVGPYSQAIQVDSGKMTFFSGQIPLDPKTGELVPGDVVAQAEQVLKNLEALLISGGLDFSHVVRSTMYLVDLADFSKVNEVYGRYFKGTPPARVTVQVAALPRGSKVEIDAIAVS